MSGMSMRQYAAHAGVSLGAIQKAKANGRLVLNADGSINAPASDERRAQGTDPSQQRGRHAQKPVPDAALNTVTEMIGESGTSPAPQSGMTFLQARTANEVLKAHERKMKVDKIKGTLVEVADVRAKVFRLAREERDAWLNWPNRVAGVIAAEIGL